MPEAENPVTNVQKEFEQSQKDMADAFKSFNQGHPLTINNGVSVVPGVSPSGDIAALNTNIEKLLTQPALKKYVKLMSSPEFADDLSAVISHPARTQCLQAEVGWFLFILVFRTWRYSKSKSWKKNLWIYLWSTLLFWAGAFYFIPHHFLDGAYDKLGSEIMSTIRE